MAFSLISSYQRLANTVRHSRYPSSSMVTTMAMGRMDNINLMTTRNGSIIQRSYWQEIIKIRKDKEGKNRHEDPERVVKRFQEQRRSDGESLLDLYFYNEKHEKAWMKRKRLNDQRRYEFDKKHVMDLAKYIQFVQDNSKK